MDEIIFTDPITPLMLKAEPAGELADEALCGMAADVLSREGDMLRVRTRYRYEGYVSEKAVTRTGSAREWESSVTHQVIAPFADVMSVPSFESGILKTLPRGGRLAASPQGDGWARAALADGTEGFVRERSVRAVSIWSGPEDELRANVTADAMRYLGAQYRWGGKSHAGIDCSGLVSMAYMLNGLYIYRDAKMADGFPVKEIPAEYARAGDLLFWDGHVALYLEDGRYIHSTGCSSGVVINSLDPASPDFREDLASVKKWGSAFAGKGDRAQ
jgi:prepilin-type processing-associated H-X9-DG protein